MKDIEAGDLFSKALNENHLVIDPKIQPKLLMFLKLMQTWNQVFNLTAITQLSDMIYLHLIDSLIIAPYLSGSLYLDVGTGAGLPGIPLAITNPQKNWVLLDKNNKKTRFLTQAIAELELPNVNVVHGRSQTFHPKRELADKSSQALYFDMIVSRAFGSLKMFIETTEHLLNPDGMLIAMKGQYPTEELNDIPTSFVVHDVIRLAIFGMDAKRHLIRLRKK